MCDVMTRTALLLRASEGRSVERGNVLRLIWGLSPWGMDCRTFTNQSSPWRQQRDPSLYSLNTAIPVAEAR